MFNAKDYIRNRDKPINPHPYPLIADVIPLNESVEGQCPYLLYRKLYTSASYQMTVLKIVLAVTGREIRSGIWGEK